MDYKTQLNARGLKATPQRLALMELLAEEGHMTIEEVYQALKTATPQLSLSTIYNNLYALTAKGIAREVAIAGCRQVFELVRREHAHLICRKCGSIVDIAADYKAIKATLLANGAILEEGDLVFNGLCAHCAKIAARRSAENAI